MAEADGRVQHWGVGPARSEAPELVVDVWVNPDGELDSHLSGPVNADWARTLREWLAYELDRSTPSKESVAFINAHVDDESVGLGKGADFSPPEVRRPLPEVILQALELLDALPDRCASPIDRTVSPYRAIGSVPAGRTPRARRFLIAEPRRPRATATPAEANPANRGHALRYNGWASAFSAFCTVARETGMASPARARRAASLNASPSGTFGMSATGTHSV